MAVVVVQAHADHADASINGRQEVGIRVRRAVMRHLEHVGRYIHTIGQHRLLRLDLDIARQQDADVSHRGPEHERRIVRVRPGVAERRGRPEHLEMDLSDVERRSDGRRVDVEPVLAEQLVH